MTAAGASTGAPIVEMLPDAPAVVAAAERIFRDAAATAIATRGRFAVALSGGRTPNDLYRRLAAAGKEALDWPHIDLFWGDERCVPADHPDSNFHNAMAAFAGAPIPAANVHRIPAETAPPEDGAAAYEATLRQYFRLAPGALPSFDLVLLGLGPDGHTASLFPDGSATAERRRLVAATWVPALAIHRITLTYPVLDAARLVVFLVTGGEKADIARRLLRDGDLSLPSAHVRPVPGALHFLLDAAAAAKL